MKRKSATMKSAADQRLTLPLSAACAPELIAVRIAAVLMPPRADMTISRSREPYISRRTSVKKDIAGCGPFALVARQPLPAQRNCVEFFKGLRLASKGKSDIGDQINKKILGPFAQANKLSDMPDFNDPNKLGSGKEMVERLTNLVAIFENPALDFSQNRADGDDLLGDAYEYLMRHFATESGKSKGQFYTPAEVSRIIAQILGIRYAKITNDTTVYDPTCGSGSLLLKIGDEARHSG